VGREASRRIASLIGGVELPLQMGLLASGCSVKDKELLILLAFFVGLQANPVKCRNHVTEMNELKFDFL
jgi:hypothetical protein